MEQAIGETNRRRAIQARYNEEHGITPETVKKAVFDMDPTSGTHDYVAIPILKKGETTADPEKLPEIIEELRSEMLLAAENLEFEQAAQIRDRITELERRAPTPSPKRRRRR
jgi:excinuclease ABC subunit B